MVIDEIQTVVDWLLNFIDPLAFKIAFISVVFTCLRYILNDRKWVKKKTFIPECLFVYSSVYIAVPILEDFNVSPKYYLIIGAAIGWAGFTKIVSFATAIINQVIDVYLTSKIGTPSKLNPPRNQLDQSKSTQLTSTTDNDNKTK